MSASAGTNYRTAVAVCWILIGALLACAPDGSGNESQDGSSGATLEEPTQIIDSIHPIEEEIHRFREGLEEVTAFEGGAPSRDELVDRFMAVLGTGDFAPLGPLLLSRAEFGYLYYPYTMYTEKPYELSPALLWFQMENLTSRGLTRLNRTFQEAPVEWEGYSCEDEPRLEGENRVWEECLIQLPASDGSITDFRLFGSIVERDGVFKFVTFSAAL